MTTDFPQLLFHPQPGTCQAAFYRPQGSLQNGSHTVAQLFGVNPRQAMHEDLQRLKSLLEEGRTSTADAKVELQ